MLDIQPLCMIGGHVPLGAADTPDMDDLSFVCSQEHNVVLARQESFDAFFVGTRPFFRVSPARIWSEEMLESLKRASGLITISRSLSTNDLLQAAVMRQASHGVEPWSKSKSLTVEPGSFRNLALSGWRLEHTAPLARLDLEGHNMTDVRRVHRFGRPHEGLRVVL